MRCFILFLLLAGCQKQTACFDLAKVVNVLGCGGREPTHRGGGGFSWCEVVLDDGAIVRVPENSAIVGRIICLDERAPI